MRVKSLLTESYECVKIGGILRNLSNDEMKIYKKVKSEGRVFKMDLSEYDANVATTMVSKGLLRRKKAQQDEGHGRIYYTTIGRKGHIKNKEITEVAPPGKESEKWIKKNKKRFKDKYGKDYEKYLYGKAWNNYNGKKKVNESILYENDDLDESDLESVKNFLEAYIKLRNIDLSRTANIDAPSIKLYETAQDLLEHLPNVGLNDCWDKIQEGISNAWSALRDTTVENCDSDYSVYNPGAYDAEATHNKINEDYGIMEIMRDYIPTDKIKKYVKQLFNSLSEKLKQYRNEESEPEFDGNFDNVETPQPSQNNETAKMFNDTVKAAKQLLAKIKLAYENSRGENIMRELIDVHDGYYRDAPFEAELDVDPDLWNAFDESFTDFMDLGYEYVDDYLNDEDLDFIVRGEEEYDSEATWDNVCEASFQDLFRGYGGSSEAESLISNLEDGFEILYEKYGKRLDIQNKFPAETEDDDSGSEFDE